MTNIDFTSDAQHLRVLSL